MSISSSACASELSVSVCLSVSACLSVCLCLSVCPSLPACLSVSVCLSVCLPVSACLSVCVFLSVCLPVSACLSVCVFLSVCLPVSACLPVCVCLSDRLVGLVVKASASRAGDPGFDSRLLRDFSGSSHTGDFKIGTPVASLPGAWRLWVNSGTGWLGVSIR